MAAWKRLTKPAPDYGQLEDRVMLSAAPIAAVPAGADLPGAAAEDAALADQGALPGPESSQAADVVHHAGPLDHDRADSPTF